MFAKLCSFALIALLCSFFLTAHANAGVNVTAEVVATGLGFVSSFRFHPDGRVFVLSWDKRSIFTIKLPYPASGPSVPWYTFSDIIGTANAGPFGITFDPHFGRNRFVYIFVAGRNVSGSVVDQVIRFKDVAGAATEPKVIFEIATPGNIREEGGFINFGPDGKLWIVVGQGTIEGNPQLQELKNNHGKLFRINKDGSFPAGNPFPGPDSGAVWAHGIRNSFGFAWDPFRAKGDMRVWETENGDSCNDEINLIPRGANLGYGPIRNCSVPYLAANTNANGAKVVLPKQLMNAVPRPPSPTGLVFCNNCGMRNKFETQLLVGFFTTNQIRAFKLNHKRNAFVSDSLVYQNDASIIGVRTGLDRRVYFSDFSRTRGSYIKKLVEDKA